MDIAQLASVGGVIEADVRSPMPGTLRLRLETPEACAAGNALLMDKTSGWRLARPLGRIKDEKPLLRDASSFQIPHVFGSR